VLEELRRRLDAQVLRVLVAGEAKRGKSILLNALLGRDVLPTGVTPVTAVATTVRFGDPESVVVRFGNGATPMGQPPAERRGTVGDVDDGWEMPSDPDLDIAEDRRHRPAGASAAGPFAARRRSRWPRIHWLTVAIVAGGGLVGGLARYVIGLAVPAPAGTFPWAVFGVNTAGAFILALLLILVLEVLPPTTYVRPLFGTGFCGALTTFSSVAVGVDQLAAHGHAATAAGYVAASLAAGLAAASFGIILGRSIAAQQEKGRQ
jgi:CrcB protein